MNDLNLIPTAGAPVGFPFLENHVRARLGIGKDEIRALRQCHLTADADWLLKKKRVWLAQAGVDKLITAKGLAPEKARPHAQNENPDGDKALKSPPAPDSVLQKNAVAKEPETVRLKVVQTCKNPHIIQCCALHDNPVQPRTMVRVRVRDNRNFVRHMEVPATLVAGYTDLYDLARPCPKKKGRW